jgi:glycosyltransferase involved in cell wall biosynthesis
VKLLQVVWNFPASVKNPFDMYYFYWPLYEAVQRGWDAEVLTFQVNDQQPTFEVIDGIKVRRCPAGVRKGKPFSWQFIKALLTTDADIIHVHGYGEWRSEIGILAGHLRRRNVIFTPHFHTYPYPRPLREFYDKTLGRSFFNLSKRVIVFTDYTARHLQHIGVRPERLRIIPHVARPEIFCDDGDELPPGTLLREAGITGSPLILGVGQLIERKGWEYTVRCLPSIVEQFPNAKFLIIGPSQPSEPLFRKRLMKLANETGVLDHVYISQDNTPTFIRDAYRSATILTHPSFVESFGMVLVEAMAAGIPIVAHNGTGLPCILDDGVTGYVVDVHDVPNYQNMMLSLLSNPQLRHKMGAEGKRQAATRFSQKNIANQLFALYGEVLTHDPSRYKVEGSETSGLEIQDSRAGELKTREHETGSLRA